MKNKIKDPEMLAPVCRCNNCLTYFYEDVTECPKCKTDNYLMDTPEFKHSEEMYIILNEVEAASRMRRPIRKATWLRVCEVLKKIDGIHR